MIARIEGDKGDWKIIAAYRVLKDGRIVETNGAFLLDTRREVLFSAVCGGGFWVVCISNCKLGSICLFLDKLEQSRKLYPSSHSA